MELANKLRAPLAMHSAASPDWGTPMVLRRFAATVLAPSANGSAIDLDYASSSYWQSWWPEPTDQPRAYLDGSKGRDVCVEADRRAADPCPGSGFLNAPGLLGGDMVQQCWALLEEDHRSQKLGSGCWNGFSIEQFGSLQNVGERNPLTTGRNDYITTIVPSRRANYVLHPEQLIAITLRKQKTRTRRSKQWLAEEHLLEKLRARSTEAPVSAGAPSHLSYVTFLWCLDRDVRRAQMNAARQFLKDQRGNPKALLYKFEVIGSLW
jgi:hypothetical protein